MAGDDLQSKASDLVKKVLTVGVGAIFLTEESLRGLISEIKLPKEMIGGILDSAGKTKNEFLSKLSTEIIDKVTTRLEPTALVEEFLAKNDVYLEIKMSFKKKE
jgi:hypothetical protein